MYISALVLVGLIEFVIRIVVFTVLTLGTLLLFLIILDLSDDVNVSDIINPICWDLLRDEE